VRSPKNKIYFSFFMFTADLRPDDESYTRTLIRHIKELVGMGYDGFDLHIADQPTTDHRAEVESYRRMKHAFDKAGLEAVQFTTNVGTTRTFDPTSPYREQRDAALAYLKSRVDITAVLGGESIMAGPFVVPYYGFPTTDANQPIWADALQSWLKPRYAAAQPVLQALGEYAEHKAVKLGIEPLKSWEIPAPNSLSDVLRFLEGGVTTAQVGLTVDTAQVIMESTGPKIFRANLDATVQQKRLHYVHISAPDRGAVHDSWIAWDALLKPILPVYDGPYLVEVFNAIPPFDSLMRLTRRKFWIPSEDAPQPGCPSAYDIARDGLRELRSQISRLSS
jgi:sugar phosphate isomerase/epimerase